MCIVSRREGDFEWKLIKKDEMAAWVPEDHPLMKAGSVSESPAVPLTVFEQYPYIDIHPGQDTDNARILAANHIHPNVQMETDDLLYAYSMVKAGLGICMSNRLTIFFEEGDVRTLPLDPPQYTEIGLAWRRDASPAAGAFVEFLTRQWDDSFSSETAQAGCSDCLHPVQSIHLREKNIVGPTEKSENA